MPGVTGLQLVTGRLYCAKYIWYLIFISILLCGINPLGMILVQMSSYLPFFFPKMHQFCWFPHHQSQTSPDWEHLGGRAGLEGMFFPTGSCWFTEAVPVPPDPSLVPDMMEKWWEQRIRPPAWHLPVLAWPLPTWEKRHRNAPVTQEPGAFWRDYT